MNFSVYNSKNLPADCRDAWRAIRASEPQLKSPVLSIDWTDAVAAVRDDVSVGVVRDGGEVVALLPWQRSSDTTAEAVGGEMADVQAAIASRAASWDMKLMLREAGIKSLSFDHWLADQEPLRPFHQAYDPAWQINLSNGFENWWADKATGSRLSQADRKRRKLIREIGPLRFEWHDRSEIALRMLLKWKRSQLAAAKYRDIFRAGWVCKLVDHIAQTNSTDMRGRLATLYAGDRLAAVHLGMQGNRVLSSWIPTYDVEISKYSPGLLLHLELIRAAANEDVETIDLGRGVNPLKQSLANDTTMLAIGSVDLRVTHRLAKSGWFALRNAVHRAPASAWLLSTYRKFRGWLDSQGEPSPGSPPSPAQTETRNPR